MEQREMWTERGKAFFGRLCVRFTAPPAAIQASGWYSSLGIEPTEFSEQLGSLQASLNGANEAVIRNAARQLESAGMPVAY